MYNVFLDCVCIVRAQQQGQKTSQKKRQRVEINVCCCCIACFIFKNVLFFTSAAHEFYDFMLCTKAKKKNSFLKMKIAGDKREVGDNFPKLQCLGNRGKFSLSWNGFYQKLFPSTIEPATMFTTNTGSRLRPYFLLKKRRRS